MSRAEITQTLNDLELSVQFYFDNSVPYTSEDQYDRFVKYGQNMVAGTIVPLGTEVKVYTTPLHLTLTYLNNLDPGLQLEPEDYAGKKFIADGIGVVTVNQYVDGDTTWFTSSGEASFSVRYLGIDTPESTALYEPWGKAAANYTRNVLSQAETIVLQAEGERQDGNGRYLAWVWYRKSAEEKFLLLNLELVELAYSKNKVSVGSQFTTVLTMADWNASLTKRRVWGEIDPAYDYSKEGTQMSIRHLLENFHDYVGLKVCVTGTVTRKIGYSVYLQDAEGYGIFMYGGHTPAVELAPGVNVTIAGLTPTIYSGSGSPQLSNFFTRNLYLNEPVDPVLPVDITYNDFVFERIGSLVRMTNLTVTYINPAGSSVRVSDGNGNSFVVRIDESTQMTASSLGIQVGSVLNVTGPLGYYDYNFDSNKQSYVYQRGNFQLMLITGEDLTIVN
jgi:micrococcal nuclease